jgi:hypothetical protein
LQHTLQLEVLGSRIDVHVDGISKDNSAQLDSLWHRCIATRPSQSDSIITLKVSKSEDKKPGGYQNFEALSSNLSSLITHRAIELANPDWMLLHAAAVADPASGRVVAFVGKSGAGKSTIAETLGKHFGYVTDETLAFDPKTGQVFAYPKPISQVIKPSESHEANNVHNHSQNVKAQLSPDSLALMVLPPTLSLQNIFFVARDSTLDEAPTASRLEELERIQLLIPQVSFLTKRTNPLKQLIAASNWNDGAQLLKYRESRDLVDFVAEKVTSAPKVLESESTEWMSVLPPVISEPDESQDDYVFVTDFQEALTNGKEVLILRNSMVTALQGIGADLWLWAQYPARFDHLVEKSLEKHGEPDSGSAISLVEKALEALCETDFLVAKYKRLP